jgi:hypothetical protein
MKNKGTSVDSTSSNLRLLPWLDIDIVSTLAHFLFIVLQVASTCPGFHLASQPTIYSLLGRTSYSWSYCSGNTQVISVYRVYPCWGSHWVTHCLADPEAVADSNCLHN